MHMCKYLFIKVKPQQYPIVQVSRNSPLKCLDSESHGEAFRKQYFGKWYIDLVLIPILMQKIDYQNVVSTVNFLV